MAFPIAMVGIVGGPAVGGVVAVGVVGGVVGKVIYDDHSDHSDHSDYTEYSDATERAAREREAKERQRKSQLEFAKLEMDETLRYIRLSLANAAGEGKECFEKWRLDSDFFSYKNFFTEYEKLDNDVKKRIKDSMFIVFNEEEKNKIHDLDNINKLIRLISEKKLTGGIK